MREAVQRRVLVIEDDLFVSRATVAILQTGGYDVRAAATGEDGLRAIAEWSPQCVLLDVMLPDISGVEVLRRVRGSAHCIPLHLFFLLTTAYGLSPEVQEGLALGASGCVMKPFSPAEFLQIVAREFEAALTTQSEVAHRDCQDTAG